MERWNNAVNSITPVSGLSDSSQAVQHPLRGDSSGRKLRRKKGGLSSAE